MKYLILGLLAACAMMSLPSRAQTEQTADEAVAVRESEQRAHIRQTRAAEERQFAAQEAQCYARFAVNDCLIKVRSRKREVLADLRRQEISINDAQRKRRAAEQLLRSDEKAARQP